MARRVPICITISAGGSKILPLPLRDGDGGRGGASTGRGRGIHGRLDFGAPCPSPRPPPARGGGGLFSGVALILMRMWRVPAIRRVSLDEYSRRYNLSGYRKFLPTIATSQGAAMPLVKIQEKGQVTLPVKIRHAVGLNSGDLVMIEKEGD